MKKQSNEPQREARVGLIIEMPNDMSTEEVGREFARNRPGEFLWLLRAFDRSECTIDEMFEIPPTGGAVWLFKWLGRPSEVLDGLVPADVAKMAGGRERVLQAVMGIAWGYYLS